jgi:hypothetical protein
VLSIQNAMRAWQREAWLGAEPAVMIVNFELLHPHFVLEISSLDVDTLEHCLILIGLSCQ